MTAKRSVRGWLVDNNVPRSVTVLLRDRGHEAVEVREALSHDAPDAAVVAYAHAQDLGLITHDRGCANRARRAGVVHVWLRTPEQRDRDRLDGSLSEVSAAIAAGAVRVTLFFGSVRSE